MLIAALTIDAGLFATIRLASRAVADRGRDRAAPPAALDAGVSPPAWAMCMPGPAGQPPAMVAITYLDADRDAAVTAPEIRGWFGDLDPTAIQVWRLEQIDGRRRIAFELAAARWPRWAELAAGLEGAALCDALHRELTGHQVGRPRGAAEMTVTDRVTRSRHDLEFLFERRARLYRSQAVVGTLAELTQAGVAEHLSWIAAAGTGAP